MEPAPQQWFETWFDTPLYETLYAHRDYAEARQLAALISQSFPPAQFPELVDIACGRGRHSFNLATLGYKVTGVDLSKNAIEKARRIASEKYADLSPDFYTHDMRQPLGRIWPLAVNLFTSFGYLADDAANTGVLRNMGDAVGPGGALVLDYLNAAYVRSSLVPEEVCDISNYQLRIRRSIDEQEGVVRKEMAFKHTQTGQLQTFTEQVKLYPLSWFEAAFAKVGMHITEVYGTYTGEKIQKQSDAHPRLIMMAQKDA
ncbi:class I SAM-dependent DNA methyltransferase [Cyclonatronum proteinivorum]|uniref:class I SAM-dependent DNA methyltransferase n=1 Tax=Cyclonatronum proteinivorum TaxID=1457365 RepID=UPI0013DEC06A|nr:class I SAM-dependent methyltransferase [Cyclonatronum proteinivorum]